MPAARAVDIDSAVGARQIVRMIGRNGMGKTTCVRSIMGMTPPSPAGSASAGVEDRPAMPHRVAR